MTKKSLITLITAAGILLSVIQSHAGTFTAFGPRAFIRGSGKPVVETASFSIKNPNTAYTLKIYNGGINSEYAKVSSAIVKLNGSTIFDTNDFNQQVSTLQKQIAVSNTNQLQVELRSALGSGLTVLMEGEDNDPPSTAITSPINNTYTNTPSATITGTASDATSWISRVTLNGTDATLTGETYTSTVRLTEGTNIITIAATDAAGNTGSATASVILDTIPPQIALDPIPSLTNQPQLVITGKVEDAGPITSLTVNGKTVGAIGQSPFQFSSDITLTEGSNNITVTATDKTGNTGETSASLTLDTTPPSISITSPANGSTVNTKTITVSGTIDDSYATVTVNGINTVVANNTFTASNINIAEGANTITVAATDPAGNTTTASISVTRKTGPAITIQSPTDGSTITTPSFTLTGTAYSNYPIVSAFVSVNGKPANPVQLKFEGQPSPGKFRYTFSIPGTAMFRDLAVGANRLTVTATDGSGGTSSAAITINLLDTTAPIISITFPATGSIVTNGTITITGTIDDDTATVIVNGINAAVSNNAFTAGITLSEGENTITITAIDLAGNRSASKITIYLDTTPPAVTYTYPKFNDTEIPVDSQIKVTFSEALNPATITSATFALNSPTESVTGTVSYSGNTATFKPQKPLSFDTIYTVTVKGGSAGIKDLAGNALTTDYAWLFKTETTVEVSISEPNNGATINKASAIIKGTIKSYTNDIGITVNGIIAEINGENWSAQIPLIIGQSAIEVTAKDNAGNTDTKSITVNTETTDQPVKITTNPQSGIAPLNTTFSIDTSISNPITSYRIDFEGDGVTDIETTTTNGITHIHETPGIYYPTITVTDGQNITYTESTMVNVLSREEMDALLKGKWASMIDALGKGDYSSALGQIVSNSQSSYQTMFSVLGNQLPAILNTAKELNLIYVSDSIAKYNLLTTENGKTYSYEVVFIKDDNGLWKIKEF